MIRKIIFIFCALAVLRFSAAITIDSQLVQMKKDCFERVALGERLPYSDTTRRVDTPVLAKCERECSNDADRCNSFSFGIGARGNGTCELSIREITSPQDLSISGAISDPDFDIYAKRNDCSDSDNQIRDPLVTARPDQDPILDSPPNSYISTNKNPGGNSYGSQSKPNGNSYGGSNNRPYDNERPDPVSSGDYNRPYIDMNVYNNNNRPSSGTSITNNYNGVSDYDNKNKPSYKPQYGNSRPQYGSSSGSNESWNNHEYHRPSRPNDNRNQYNNYDKDRYYIYENTLYHGDDKLHWKVPDNPYMQNGVLQPDVYGERFPYNQMPYRMPIDYDMERDYYDRRPIDREPPYEFRRPYGSDYDNYSPYDYYDRPLGPERPLYYESDPRPVLYDDRYINRNFYNNDAIAHVYGQEIAVANNGYGNMISRPNNGYGNLPSRPNYGYNDFADMNYGSIPSGPSSSYGSVSNRPTNNYGSAFNKPANNYGSTQSRPESNYGNKPSRPTNDYANSPNRPSNDYGNSPSRPSNDYGNSPSKPSNDYGNSPNRPSNDYGNSPNRPSNDYGNSPSRPSNDYGNSPSRPSSGYGNSPSRPSNDYGNSASRPSNGYGNSPSNDYGNSPSRPNDYGNKPNRPDVDYGSTPDRPSAGYGNTVTRPGSNYDGNINYGYRGNGYDNLDPNFEYFMSRRPSNNNNKNPQSPGYQQYPEYGVGKPPMYSNNDRPYYRPSPNTYHDNDRPDPNFYRPGGYGNSYDYEEYASNFGYLYQNNNKPYENRYPSNYDRNTDDRKDRPSNANNRPNYNSNDRFENNYPSSDRDKYDNSHNYDKDRPDPADASYGKGNDKKQTYGGSNDKSEPNNKNKGSGNEYNVNEKQDRYGTSSVNEHKPGSEGKYGSGSERPPEGPPKKANRNCEYTYFCTKAR